MPALLLPDSTALAFGGRPLLFGASAEVGLAFGGLPGPRLGRNAVLAALSNVFTALLESLDFRLRSCSMISLVFLN